MHDSITQSVVQINKKKNQRFAVKFYVYDVDQRLLYPKSDDIIPLFWLCRQIIELFLASSNK